MRPDRALLRRPQVSGRAESGGPCVSGKDAGAHTRVFFLLSARLRGVIFIPKCREPTVRCQL